MRPFSFFLLSTPRKKGVKQKLENPNLPRPKAGRGRRVKSGGGKQKKPTSPPPLWTDRTTTYFEIFSDCRGFGGSPHYKLGNKKIQREFEKRLDFFISQTFSRCRTTPILATFWKQTKSDPHRKRIWFVFKCFAKWMLCEARRENTL